MTEEGCRKYSASLLIELKSSPLVPKDIPEISMFMDFYSKLPVKNLGNTNSKQKKLKSKKQSKSKNDGSDILEGSITSLATDPLKIPADDSIGLDPIQQFRLEMKLKEAKESSKNNSVDSNKAENSLPLMDTDYLDPIQKFRQEMKLKDDSKKVRPETSFHDLENDLGINHNIGNQPQLDPIQQFRMQIKSAVGAQEMATYNTNNFGIQPEYIPQRPNILDSHLKPRLPTFRDRNNEYAVETLFSNSNEAQAQSASQRKSSRFENFFNSILSDHQAPLINPQLCPPFQRQTVRIKDSLSPKSFDSSFNRIGKYLLILVRTQTSALLEPSLKHTPTKEDQDGMAKIMAALSRAKPTQGPTNSSTYRFPDQPSQFGIMRPPGRPPLSYDHNHGHNMPSQIGNHPGHFQQLGFNNQSMMHNQPSLYAVSNPAGYYSNDINPDSIMTSSAFNGATEKRTKNGNASQRK